MSTPDMTRDRFLGLIQREAKRQSMHSWTSDANQLDEMVPPELVQILSDLGLTLALDKGIQEMLPAFASLQATLHSVASSEQARNNFMTAGVVEGLRIMLMAMVRDVYDRFGYEVEIGLDQRHTDPRSNRPARPEDN